MNEGMMIHPMHLHGMHMTVIAKDGLGSAGALEVRHPQRRPGERWDVIVNCNNPGTWAFHATFCPTPNRPRHAGDGDALIVK
jgi:FtsP/CotA-like multicopper oxidase with cupredoxin domain